MFEDGFLVAHLTWSPGFGWQLSRYRDQRRWQMIQPGITTWCCSRCSQAAAHSSCCWDYSHSCSDILRNSHFSSTCSREPVCAHCAVSKQRARPAIVVQKRSTIYFCCFSLHHCVLLFGADHWHRLHS